ncbi:MAG: PepSY domain-containing protein [Gemmatimonadales bacterium]
MRRTLTTLSLLAGVWLPLAAQPSNPMQQPTQQAQGSYKREVPDSLVAKAKITEDSARAVALKRVPGGTIQGLELENEHGHLIYSWDIKVAGKPGITEVHVSALNGRVLRVEHEGATPKRATRRSS